MSEAARCEHCKTRGSLIRLLTRAAVKRAGGGRIWWCRACGALRLLDSDKTVFWTWPGRTKRWEAPDEMDS